MCRIRAMDSIVDPVSNTLTYGIDVQEGVLDKKKARVRASRRQELLLVNMAVPESIALPHLCLLWAQSWNRSPAISEGGSKKGEPE